MSTSKYIRPMSFGELVISTSKVYVKTLWPIWILYLLFIVAMERLHWKLLLDQSSSNAIMIATIYDRVWSYLSIFLPAFLIGPAMLIISNLILGRPKKSWSSFMKGMSLGMILKIFLYFSPALIAIIILIILGYQVFGNFGTFYLIFTVPLLLFMPVWVFYPMILLLEKKGVIESIRRTGTFISGQLKRLFQIQILSIVLTSLLTPLGLKYWQNAYNILPINDPVYAQIGWSYYTVLRNFISMGFFFTMPLTFGFAITMYVLHYYQVRAQKENFNEELLAQELGYQPVEEMMTV